LKAAGRNSADDWIIVVTILCARAAQLRAPGEGRVMTSDESNLEMLTTTEMMRLLKIKSRTTIRKLVQSGDLPAYRVARDLRFKRREVEAYLERNRVKP